MRLIHLPCEYFTVSRPYVLRVTFSFFCCCLDPDVAKVTGETPHAPCLFEYHVALRAAAQLNDYFFSEGHFATATRSRTWISSAIIGSSVTSRSFLRSTFRFSPICNGAPYILNWICATTLHPVPVFIRGDLAWCLLAIRVELCIFTWNSICSDLIALS